MTKEVGTRRTPAPTSRSPGWATRWSTKCSSRWPQRTSGTASSPLRTPQFASHNTNPELAQLLPALYTPNGGATVFPHLAAYNAGSPNRADLVAILLTGIPAGVVSPKYSTFTGHTQADMLRLNLAIAPVANTGGHLAGNNMGALGGISLVFRMAGESSTTWSISRYRQSWVPCWAWLTRALRPTARSMPSPKA